MDATSCPRCGSAVPPGPEGLCPTCILMGALSARPPRRLGGYELVEIIGRGGMGVVHRARQVSVGHEVALKRIRAGELATDDEVDRFVHEARTASRLSHPNIVRIYHVEEHEGRPFFTMELLEGGSLDQAMERFRDPLAAARLMALVARAVHHAHDRGVLHRDIKPANILLDPAGEPRVADFGVAKVHGASLETGSGLVPGTVPYMAPEQAAGRDVTRAADVWSLAAILYELLTGARPFEGRTPADVVRRAREEEPARPRALRPELSRDLETICLKGLRKEPGARYGDAAELALDLERFLRGEPIAARPLGAAGRSALWARRHPVATSSTVAVVMLVGGVIAALAGAVAAQEEEMRRDVLEANVYAARAVAGTLLFELQALSDRVLDAAADPAVVALAASGSCGANDGAEALLARHGAGSAFDSLTVFDARGRSLRRWPAPLSAGYELCGDFSWRDYFRGARALGERGLRAVHVARAILSEGDGERKFAIAAPVHDGAGAFAGVVDATLGTDSALGGIRLRDPSDARRTAVLVAPMDVERDCRGCPLPATQVVLLHDALPHGRTATLESPKVSEIQARIAALAGAAPFRIPPEDLALADADHRDPLVPGALWLAGLAPVGLTGYVVIVQTRHDAAIEANVALLRRLVRVGGAALLLGALVAGVLVRMNAARARAA